MFDTGCFFFVVSALKQALKECKKIVSEYDLIISFAAISLAVAFKRRKLDYG